MKNAAAGTAAKKQHDKGILTQMAKTEARIAARAKPHTIYRTADGKRVPGVTTVLGIMNKPALVKWANTLGLQGIDSSAYVDETARVGTLAHEMIQEYLGGRRGTGMHTTPGRLTSRRMRS